MDRGNDSKPSSRAEKRLTALEVKAFADRAEIGKKLIDGGGLMLVVLKSGSSSWRIRYWLDSKEKTYSVGTYPEVTLEAAREALANVRKRIKFGDDPVKARQVEVAARIVSSGTTFEAVTQEWLKLRRKDWGDDHYSRSERALERDVLPTLGKLPIADITPAMVSGVVTKIARLLRAIDAFRGTLIVQSALKLSSLVFVRPGERRQAEWSEIDLEKGEWNIPASRMKGWARKGITTPHLVPLAPQAMAILRDLQPLPPPSMPA